MPGVTMGQAVDVPAAAGGARCCRADFRHDFLSQSRQYVREGNQLTVTFVFALIIIYLVLAAQFESLRDPLVILVSVPMSICGALLPLFFGLATLNIYTQIGLVTLIGLISKHGILMVEFANELQRDGEPRPARGDRARRPQVRLRPILMTTAAMVVGLIPLLVGHRRRCRQPVLDRPRHRRRHVDRHAVHPVRPADRLHAAGRRPPPGTAGPARGRAAERHAGAGVSDCPSLAGPGNLAAPPPLRLKP